MFYTYTSLYSIFAICKCLLYIVSSHKHILYIVIYDECIAQNDVGMYRLVRLN